MDEKVVLDSCTIIDFFKGVPDAISIDLMLSQYDCFISFITKLETLGCPDMPKSEERDILNFLPKVTILPMSETIENETIAIRRNTNLKLPDAIIAATAIAIGAEVASTDSHFLKCPYPKLHVWRNE
jgi:predicted nucleic acid-binding protein